MALGDVLTSPELCTKAVSAGALRPLVEAMNRYPAAHSLQINGCCALVKLWNAASAEGDARTLTANMAYRVGVPDAIMGALKFPQIRERLGVERHQECMEVADDIQKASDEYQEPDVPSGPKYYDGVYDPSQKVEL